MCVICAGVCVLLCMWYMYRYLCAFVYVVRVQVFVCVCVCGICTVIYVFMCASVREATGQ